MNAMDGAMDGDVPEATLTAESQREVERLRAQLDRLTADTRQQANRRRRFDRIEQQMMAAPTLVALVQTLLVDLPALFELDAVTLALVDPGFDAARALANAPNVPVGQGANEDDAWAARLLLLGGSQALRQIYASGMQPLLGAPDAAQAFLFKGANFTGNREQAGLASTALLPLLLHGACIGSLNLGSRDSKRFVPGAGREFLERLASIAALALDNALMTERLKAAGLLDALTGVYNRRYFETRCMEELQAARRSGRPLACMLIDLDDFSRINSKLGHSTGDVVLRQLARMLRRELRGGDVLARHGGEEFAILLPDTPEASARQLAERLRRIIADHPMSVSSLDGEAPLHVTVSIGLVVMEESPGSKPEQKAQRGAQQEVSAQLATQAVSGLLERAARALEAAKRGGRNRVQVAG